MRHRRMDSLQNSLTCSSVTSSISAMRSRCRPFIWDLGNLTALAQSTTWGSGVLPIGTSSIQTRKGFSPALIASSLARYHPSCSVTLYIGKRRTESRSLCSSSLETTTAGRSLALSKTHSSAPVCHASDSSCSGVARRLRWSERSGARRSFIGAGYHPTGAHRTRPGGHAGGGGAARNAALLRQVYLDVGKVGARKVLSRIADICLEPSGSL